MTASPLRVASRYLQAMHPWELSESLRKLAKFNDGFWKSERQAAYLLRVLVTESKSTSPAAKRWAKGIPGYTPDAFVFDSIESLSHLGYGKRDPSKIRMMAWLFVVDDQGVLAQAKAKVRHPKGGATSEDDYRVLPETIETTFVRPRGAVGDVSVDMRGKLQQEEDERQERIRANQPLIDKIKAVPYWDDKEILRSFVEQLEAGHELSERQKVTLDNIIPESVEFDAESWRRIKGENDRILDRVVIPVLIEGEHALAREIPDYEPADKEIRRWWSEYMRGGTPDQQANWATLTFTEFLDAIDKQVPRRSWTYTADVADQMYKAIRRMERGKPPTKKSTESYVYHKRLNRKLKGMNRSKAVAVWNKAVGEREDVRL